MEWWGWAAWSISSTAAAFGLFFGIRAERRASYKPIWVVTPDHGLTNRTGEDAGNVRVFIQSRSGERSSHKAISVAPDETVSFMKSPVQGTIELFVVWVRPTTGRMYWWPRSARSGTRRIRQHHRGVMRRSRKRNTRLPQLGELSPEARADLKWWDWRP